MSNKKPEPIFPAAETRLCPVCGKASYSATGIHPQCAVKQADDKHRAIQKQVESETSADQKNLDGQKQKKRYQKTCPKCNRTQHVRKNTCDCGFAFN